MVMPHRGSAFQEGRLSGTKYLWGRRVGAVAMHLALLACAQAVCAERRGANVSGAHSVVTALDMASLTDIVVPDANPWGSVGSLSPDGARIAILIVRNNPLDNTVTARWLAVPTNGSGDSVDLGSAGEPYLRVGDDGTMSGERGSYSMPKWSPDGHWVAYLANEGGEVQLWRTSVDGKIRQQLTRSAADLKDFAWSRDGTKVFLASETETREQRRARREQSARTGYLIDDAYHPRYSLVPLELPSRDRNDLILDVGEGVERALTAAESAELEEISRARPTLDFVTKRQAQAQQASPTALDQQVGYRMDVALPAEMRSSPERVAFADIVTPADRAYFPTTQIAVVEGGSSTPRHCRHAECHGVFRRIGWNERGEVIFHLQSVDLENKGIFAWNPKSDALRPIAKISAPALEIQHCLPSERTWICIRDDATHPPALVAIDVLSGKATTLFDPNPAFASKAFTRVERIEWTNDFGQSTFGQLVYPRGYRKGQRYPLVILSYRAVGFLDASTGREYPAHVLADQGFLVLVFNRSFARVWGQGTAGQYNEAFRDRREIQSSLEAGIRLIERRGLVDSDRVAIGGLSDGAAIVEWALLHSSRPYAAAMSSSGGFEPIWYYLGTAQVRRMIREDMGATFSAQGLEGSLVETLAMSRNASRLRTPLLYNLPDAEVLPAMQAIVTLNELGKPIEAHVYPREYHEKVQPAHRLAVYRRNVQWLQFWLQGKEAPDPVDAGQYTRWRVLRERQLANVPRASAAHVPLGRAEPAG